MVTYKRDRYVVVRIISDLDFIEETLLKTSVWKTFQTIFGLYGSAGAGLYFEDYQENEKTGIIRCSHTSLQHLLTVLALMNEIKERKILFQIVNVSGTIKKARRFITTK